MANMGKARFVIFGSKVWFSGSVNSTVSLRMTHVRPFLPWQRNWRQNRL